MEDDEDEDEDDDLRPIVLGCFYVASTSEIYGPSNIGKSMTVVDLMCCISLGRPWLGFPVIAGGAVNFCFASEGGAGLRRRITAWERLHNNCDPVPNIVFKRGPQQLSSPIVRDKIIQYIQKKAAGRPVGLIFFDSKSKHLAACRDEQGRPFAESSNDAQNEFDRFVRIIAEATGGCAVSIAHTGKDVSKGARGGSSAMGAAETMFEMVRPNPDRPLDINFVSKKTRDGGFKGTFGYQMNVVDLGYSEETKRAYWARLCGTDGKNHHEVHIDDPFSCLAVEGTRLPPFPEQSGGGDSGPGLKHQEIALLNEARIIINRNGGEILSTELKTLLSQRMGLSAVQIRDRLLKLRNDGFLCDWGNGRATKYRLPDAPIGAAITTKNTPKSGDSDVYDF
ncbi:AAA family ATPase [Erwinia sp. S59]|uniref:AAA family ATPase n=1 Tax=Erwinia sp. S59 TaxID=2769340 RepID=UPI00190ACA30|nr:AAA family ATPase [Erwinia sp. S59]MBK0092804.1 AAA family ATPase [Erwinia sp. S59]